jgi:hypothetical protein
MPELLAAHGACGHAWRSDTLPAGTVLVPLSV